MTNTLAYLLDKKVYINLTNKCTNSCIFCLRQDRDDVCGKNMWLETEDFSAKDVIEQLSKIDINEYIMEKPIYFKSMNSYTSDDLKDEDIFYKFESEEN